MTFFYVMLVVFAILLLLPEFRNPVVASVKRIYEYLRTISR